MSKRIPNSLVRMPSRLSSYLSTDLAADLTTRDCSALVHSCGYCSHGLDSDEGAGHSCSSGGRSCTSYNAHEGNCTDSESDSQSSLILSFVFLQASCTASVTIDSVAIVAFFASVNHTIAAVDLTIGAPIVG